MHNTLIHSVKLAASIALLLTGCTYRGYYNYCQGEMAELYCLKNTPIPRREFLWQKVLNKEPLSGYGKSWGEGYKKERIIRMEGPPLRVIPADNERYDEILDYGDWKMLMKDDHLVEVIEPNLDGSIPQAFYYAVYQNK